MKSKVVASGLRHNLTRIVVLSFLLLAGLPLAAAAEDPPPGYIRIVVVNNTFSSPTHIQVRDEVCKKPRSIECEEARIKVSGEICQKHPGRPRCEEAEELLKSSLCVEGLVFDGRMIRDQEVHLDVCASEMGLGNVSVRNPDNGPGIWTNYAMVTNGREISYH
jgi:hypothetical protein